MPTPARRRSTVLLASTAIVAVAALAVVIGTLVSHAKLGPYVYFMPGPLGRQQVPLGAVAPGAADDQMVRSSDDQIVRSSGHSTIGSADHQTIRPSVHPGDSAFLTRTIGLRAGEEAEWGLHNGLTPRLNFSHHLSTVFPRELFATHPEFFPLENGRRFDPPKGYEYWNPDLGREAVARYAAQQAGRYFDNHPDAVSYSLGVNDGLLFGESPEMLAVLRAASDRPMDRWPDGQTGRRADSSPADGNPAHPIFRPSGLPTIRWFRGRPDYSPLVFTFMNRAAAELAKTYPDKYLGCLAYYWCENTPPFAVDPHVIPFLTADRSQFYDPAFRREEFRLQERWAKAVRAPSNGRSVDQSIGDAGADDQRSRWTDHPTIRQSVQPFDRSTVRPPDRRDAIAPRIGLYDYLDGQGFLVPRVPIHAFAENIRHAHQVGFTDYYGESSRNWGLDGPLPWVIAQLLQNPEQNVDALLDEYYQCYFQSAAGPMRQFFDRCEQQWMRQTGPSYWLKYYRNEAQADLFPPDVCRELRALLNKAMQLSQEVTETTEDAKTQTTLFSLFSPVQTDRPLDQSATADRQMLRKADRQMGRSSDHQTIRSSGNRVADRVRFVSDAFGVTERFVAFQNARTRLAHAVLTPRSDNSELRTLLTQYREKRTDFVHYTHEITRKWPLALYPINWNDWLRDDPGFAAEARLKHGRSVEPSIGGSEDRRGLGGSEDPSSSRSVDQSRRESAIRSTARPLDRSTARPIDRSTTQPINRSTAPRINRSRSAELLGAADLSGPITPGRRIAGLKYGIDLPAPWQSRVEPTQHGVAVLRNRWPDGRKIGSSADLPEDLTIGSSDHPPLLHLQNQVNATAYQWVRVKPGAVYAASVQTRGRVTSGDAVMLTLAWVDQHQRPLGNLISMCLPAGNWPDWVTLRQGAAAPPNAAWLGIAIRVQNQVGDDFADFADFQLREIIADEKPNSRNTDARK